MLEFYHILEDYTNVQEAAFSFNSKNDELNLVSDRSIVNTKKEIPESDKVVDQIEFDENGRKEKPEEPYEVNQKKKHIETIDFIPSSSRSMSLNEGQNNEFVTLNIEEEVKLFELPIYEKVLLRFSFCIRILVSSKLFAKAFFM